MKKPIRNSFFTILPVLLLFLSCFYWDNRHFIEVNMDGGMAVYSGEKANKANKTWNQYSLDLKSDSTYFFRYSVCSFGSDVLFIRVSKSGTWSIKEDVLILANAPAQFFEYPEIPFATPLSTDFKRTMSNQIEFRVAKEGEYVTPLSARLIPLKLLTSGIIRNIILERIHKNKKMKTN